MVVKLLKEAVKSPVRWKWHGYVKTTIMSNQKVIIKIINKVCDYGKVFAFHDNECTDYSVVGKSFPSVLGNYGTKDKSRFRKRES